MSLEQSTQTTPCVVPLVALMNSCYLMLYSLDRNTKAVVVVVVAAVDVKDVVDVEVVVVDVDVDVVVVDVVVVVVVVVAVVAVVVVAVDVAGFEDFVTVDVVDFDVAIAQ